MTRRIGLFGGSFDPVHRGHLYVARAALEAFELDRVAFVPAARPPHKPGRELAPGAHRMAMLELAIRDEPAFCSSDLELEREGPSYTVDTVRELAARLGEPPDARVFLVLGSDNLEGLPGWYRFDELIERVQPVIVPRERDAERLADAIERTLADVRAREERAGASGWVERVRAGLLDLPARPGRSTELRAAVGRGSDPGDGMLPEVADYIAAHGLYGSGA